MAAPAAPGRPSLSIHEQLLVADFNQCFQHLRYYEEWFRKILEFDIGLLLAVAAAFAALIGKYGRTPNALTAGSILCGLCSIAGLFLLAALARNRVQLALVSRFVNEIRAAYLSTAPGGVTNTTRMYSDPKRPQNYDAQSVHTIALYFVAMTNSLMVTVCLSVLPSALRMMDQLKVPLFSLSLSALTFLGALILHILMVRVYWWRN